jgi:hypothetical protein
VNRLDREAPDGEGDDQHRETQAEPDQVTT